ncbi:MAG: isoprenylcysteine carboxylmethyltransferase family protein [Bacteroidota bacterium]
MTTIGENTKGPSVWEHLKAILILPFTVVVVIPTILYHLYPIFFRKFSFVETIGSVFFLLGLALFIQSLILFVRIGKGTLAPWNPTRKLVVRGLYRFTRNPMILGVCNMLLGIGFWFSSLAIILWGVIFFIGTHIHFMRKEEPQLKDRFGEEYDEYRDNVPRWFPRFSAWRPEE